MNSKYIKSHTEFVNELNRDTVLRAVHKLKDLGHNKKAQALLDRLPKSEEEFTVDLVVYEYKNIGEIKLPRSFRDFEDNLGQKQRFKERKSIPNSDRTREVNVPVLIEDARLINIDAKLEEVYLLFTDKEEKIVFYMLIRLTKIDHEGDQKLVFSGKTVGNSTKLAYKKDIKELVKMIQQEYNNNQIGGGIRGRIHAKGEVSDDVNLTDLIPTMFEDLPRTFYTDENINVLKSKGTIDKYNL
jgi:hypothetical protein